MATNRVAFGILAAACVAAAAGGAFIASRYNASDEARLTAGRTATLPVADAARPSGSVEATEAVIADSPADKDASTTIPVGAATEASASAAAAPAPAARPARETRAAANRRSQPPVRSSRSGSSQPAEPAETGWSGLEKPWPSGAASAEQPATPPEPVAPPPAPEPPPPPPPPEKTFEELVVSADSVIGLQVETAVTSERARVEDKVEARVTRDVTVGDKVAIPAGSRALGSVTAVERGGKIKERARLGIRFHTLVLADGTHLPIQTETVYRDGPSPSGESAAKIGGAAVGGAILGAILGGTRGAVIGGTTGAAGGTAAVMAGDRNPATLPAGAAVTVRIMQPVTVTVEKE